MENQSNKLFARLKIQVLLRKTLEQWGTDQGLDIIAQALEREIQYEQLQTQRRISQHNLA
jgi:hypothetical protein